MSNLISLEEYEAQAAASRAAREVPAVPYPNGIACPDCGEELMDSNPVIVLASIPPRKNIHCAKEGCGFTGTRTV